MSHFFAHWHTRKSEILVVEASDSSMFFTVETLNREFNKQPTIILTVISSKSIMTKRALILAAFALLGRQTADGYQIRRIQNHQQSHVRQQSCWAMYDISWADRIITSKTVIRAINSESLMINGSSKNKRGSISPFFEGIDVAALPDGGELLPTVTIESESPPMSFEKFVTMQEKRAVVTIRYSGDAGLKPYFLTVAKKLKQSYPDIIIERRILPSIEDGYYEPTFEILVEGKVVIGKGGRSRKLSRNGNSDAHDGRRRSVYVSMNELDMAITRARRKHRPTTLYGSGAFSTTSIAAANNKDDTTKQQRLNGSKLKNHNLEKSDWTNM